MRTPALAPPTRPLLPARPTLQPSAHEAADAPPTAAVATAASDATEPAPATEGTSSRALRPETASAAHVYNTSRSLGNLTAGVLVGASTEALASTAQTPRVLGKIFSNVWKAEVIGPNLKVLGTLAALPAAALVLGLSPVMGAVRGAVAARTHEDTGLREDTSDWVAHELTDANDNGEAKTFSGRVCQSLDAFGSRKLEQGEKPYDVPLLSPAFAVVGGVASGAIGGAVGLVAGLVAGTVAAGKDLKEAATSSDLSAGQRLGKVLSAPLNVVVGPALAWKSVKEAVPRGLSDGWKHGPLRPIADTVRISTSLGSSVIREAWEK